MGGDLPALGDDLLGRLVDGRPADGERARSVGAHAERRLLRVAMDHLDLVRRDAELGRDQLGEGGLVPLAVAVGAGVDEHVARRVEADLRALPQADAGAQRADRRRRRDAAGLDVAGKADAAQLSPGPALRLRLRAAGIEIGRAACRERVWPYV